MAGRKMDFSYRPTTDPYKKLDFNNRINFNSPTPPIVNKPMLNQNSFVPTPSPHSGALSGSVFSSQHSKTPTAVISGHQTICTPDQKSCVTVGGTAIKIPNVPLITNVQASGTHTVCKPPNDNPCVSVSANVSKTNKVEPQVGGSVGVEFKL